MLNKNWRKISRQGGSINFNADEDSKEIEVLHEIYDDLKGTKQDLKEVLRMSQKCTKAHSAVELTPFATALLSFQDRLGDGEDKEAIEGSTKRLGEMMNFMQEQKQRLVFQLTNSFEQPTYNYVHKDISEAMVAMAAFDKVNESYRQLNKKVKSMNSKRYNNISKFQEVQLEQTQLKRKWEAQKEETMHCVSKAISKHEFFAVETMNNMVESYRDYFLIMANHMEKMSAELMRSGDRVAEKKKEFLATYPEESEEGQVDTPARPASSLSPLSPRLKELKTKQSIRSASFTSTSGGVTGKKEAKEAPPLRDMSSNRSDPNVRRKKMRSVSVDKRYGHISQCLAYEKEYVTSLQKIADIRHLIEQDDKAVSKVPQVTMDIIFSNIDEITRVHVELLANLKKMAQNWSPRQCIGSFFRTQADRMQIYAEYIREFPTSSYCLQKCKKSKHFDSTLRAAEAQVGATLPNLLSAPLPRIAQFCIFLEKLTTETTRTHPDYEQLTNALVHFAELNSFLSQSSFSSEILDKLSDIQAKVQGIENHDINLAEPHRRLVKEGAVGLIRRTRDGHTSGKAGKREECYVYLFNDMILFAKKSTSIIKNKNKQLLYVAGVPLANATMEVDFVQGGFRLATDKGVFVMLSDKGDERSAWKDAVSSVLRELQKPQVFGVAFEALMQSDNEQTRVTPSLLEACSKFLAKVKYTVSSFCHDFAPYEDIERWVTDLDNGSPPHFEDSEGGTEENPAVVAGLVYRWFQELPEPLTSFALYPQFLEAEGDVVLIRDALFKLPVFDRFSLEMVMNMFVNMVACEPSQGEGSNQASAIDRLVVLIAPHLFKSEAGLFAMDKLTEVYSLATVFLENYEAIFGDTREERIAVSEDTKAMSHLRRQYMSLQGSKHSSSGGLNLSRGASLDLSEPSTTMVGASRGAQALVSPRSKSSRKSGLRESSGKRKKKRSSTHLSSAVDPQWRPISKTDSPAKKIIGSRAVTSSNVSSSTSSLAPHQQSAFGNISRSINSSAPNVSVHPRSSTQPPPVASPSSVGQKSAPSTPVHASEIPQRSKSGARPSTSFTSPTTTSPPGVYTSSISERKKATGTSRLQSVSDNNLGSVPDKSGDPVVLGAHLFMPSVSSASAAASQATTLSQRLSQLAQSPNQTSRSGSGSGSYPFPPQKKSSRGSLATASSPRGPSSAPVSSESVPVRPSTATPSQVSSASSIPTNPTLAPTAPVATSLSSVQKPTAAAPVQPPTSYAPVAPVTFAPVAAVTPPSAQPSGNQFPASMAPSTTMPVPVGPAPSLPPTAFNCAACSQPTGENRMWLLGKYWHPQCFVCTRCHQPFKDGKYFEHDGMPYCENEYQALQTVCAGCEQPIAGAYLQAMGRNWHPEHFLCAQCKGSLAMGFFEINHKPFCNSCKTLVRSLHP